MSEFLNFFLDQKIMFGYSGPTHPSWNPPTFRRIYRRKMTKCSSKSVKWFKSCITEIVLNWVLLDYMSDALSTRPFVQTSSSVAYKLEGYIHVYDLKKLFLALLFAVIVTVFESQKNFGTIFSSISLQKIFFFEKPRHLMFFMRFGPRWSFYEKSSGVLWT